MIRIPGDIDKYINDIKKLVTINSNNKVKSISFDRINVNKDGLENKDKESKHTPSEFDSVFKEEMKKYL